LKKTSKASGRRLRRDQWFSDNFSARYRPRELRK
jgi:hypothetical protein